MERLTSSDMQSKLKKMDGSDAYNTMLEILNNVPPSYIEDSKGKNKE